MIVGNDPRLNNSESYLHDYISPPQEVDSRFRFGWLLAAGFIVAILLLIGVAVSAVLHSAIPKFFESHAVVLIEPRSPLPEPDNSFRPDDVMIRHDQLICEDNIVTKALIKYDLNGLATLQDLPSEDQILHIQNNLEVQPSEETDHLYHLRYRSSRLRQLFFKQRTWKSSNFRPSNAGKTSQPSWSKHDSNPEL